MAEPSPHPKRLPRTPSQRSSFVATDGRAGTDSSILRGTGTVAHHFHAVCGEGGAVCRGPRPTSSFGPQRELLPARLVIYRTDLCRNNVENAEGCIRGRASVLLPPATLATDNGRAPHFGARHEEAAAWEGGRYSPVHRVSGSELLRLRTHRLCGWSRPLRSAVVEYQAPSVAV